MSRRKTLVQEELPVVQEAAEMIDIYAEAIPVKLNDREFRELEVQEAIIQRGLNAFWEVGQALSIIKEAKLYRAEFSSFDQYCEKKWDMSGRHARRQIAAAEVVARICESGLPKDEKQIRDLAQLDPNKQIEVWSQLVEESPNGQPSSAAVSAAVAASLGKATSAPTPALGWNDAPRSFAIELEEYGAIEVDYSQKEDGSNWQKYQFALKSAHISVTGEALCRAISWGETEGHSTPESWAAKTASKECNLVRDAKLRRLKLDAKPGMVISIRDGEHRHKTGTVIERIGDTLRIELNVSGNQKDDQGGEVNAPVIYCERAGDWCQPDEHKLVKPETAKSESKPVAPDPELLELPEDLLLEWQWGFNKHKAPVQFYLRSADGHDTDWYEVPEEAIKEAQAMQWFKDNDWREWADSGYELACKPVLHVESENGSWEELIQLAKDAQATDLLSALQAENERLTSVIVAAKVAVMTWNGEFMTGEDQEGYQVEEGGTTEHGAAMIQLAEVLSQLTPGEERE